MKWVLSNGHMDNIRGARTGGRGAYCHTVPFGPERKKKNLGKKRKNHENKTKKFLQPLIFVNCAFKI